MSVESYSTMMELAWQLHVGIRSAALVGATCGKKDFSERFLLAVAKVADNYDLRFRVIGYPPDRLFMVIAKHEWALDLYALAARLPHDAEHALRGLLHGISAVNIQDFLIRCNQDKSKCPTCSGHGYVPD